MNLRNPLLWIDGLSALLAGSVVLILIDWFVKWYRLPYELLTLVSVVNLIYASYAISLAVYLRRIKLMIVLLVVANLVWAAVCVGFVIVYGKTMSIFGFAHLLGEALFVVCLAGLEWRYRAFLENK